MMLQNVRCTMFDLWCEKAMFIYRKRSGFSMFWLITLFNGINSVVTKLIVPMLLPDFDLPGFSNSANAVGITHIVTTDFNR